MTTKDLVALLVFVFCMFAMCFLGAYYFWHKSCDNTVIELPKSIRINPDLK